MTAILSALAWPYANGPRHIGHVAGFGVPADIFSRYMRLMGHDVLMVSGTDEHGTPILVAADEAGLSPRELADRNNEIIVQDLVALGLSYDLFTRTTTANHYQVVRDMFEVVRDNGYLLERTARAAISPSTGRTLPDRYIEGECPLCGYEGARGDQCDNCGKQLDPTDLKNPRSKINGETPTFVDSTHWFLDLPALADELGRWLDGREETGTWRPNVIKFSKHILDEIRPRAITRDIDWGIPVPGWDDQPGKRLYVWFDAVIGYLSASIEWARLSGEPEAWRRWWNDPTAESYYFMGKDNIVFHSQIWPAELLAYNGEGSRGGTCGELGPLNLPTEVVSSEFLTMEGAKFSSSRGIVIYVRDMLARYQVDALRYFIAAAGPETSDADFTWSEFVRRTNGELVAGWGNLVNRACAMIAKNFGQIPAPGELQEVDRALLGAVEQGFETVGEHIRTHHFKAGINEIMRIVGEANRYVAATEPFKLKDPALRPRLATILHTLASAVSSINVLISPYLPHSANTIDQLLGGNGQIAPLPRAESTGEHLVITGDYSGTIGWAVRPVRVGAPVSKPSGVFTKLDESIVAEELARMGSDG